MQTVLQLVQVSGFTVYATILVVLTVWTTATCQRSTPVVCQPIRWQQRLGVLLGLSLGACIFGALVGRWMDTGTLQWHWGFGPERQDTILLLVFIVAWASNIKLEIWTLEPLRQLDPAPWQGQPKDEIAYSGAAHSLRNHLLIHSALLVSITVLWINHHWTSAFG